MAKMAKSEDMPQKLKGKTIVLNISQLCQNYKEKHKKTPNAAYNCHEMAQNTIQNIYTYLQFDPMNKNHLDSRI